MNLQMSMPLLQLKQFMMDIMTVSKIQLEKLVLTVDNHWLTLLIMNSTQVILVHHVTMSVVLHIDLNTGQWKLCSNVK